LIDKLDLTKDPTEEESEEQLKPELTFNPALQYFNQVVVNRISNPDVAELPQLNEGIANYVRPDRHMFEQAQNEVSAFEEAFKLQYNVESENRVKKRVYWKDIIKREEQKASEEQKMVAEEEERARMKLANKENGDGFDFKDADVKEISSVTPVIDFNKMVNDRKVDRVADAL
jgi:hypothetical protein